MTDSAAPSLVTREQGRPRSRRVRDRLSYAGVVLSSVLVAVAAGAGTPLLALDQRRWGFPTWALTVGFTVYAVTLLATLLVAGSLSDHVGRRAVLIGALTLMVGSGVLFLAADSIGWIVTARAVQGVATGAATSTFTASIIELASERRRRIMTVVTSGAPVGGLALGALLTSSLIDVVKDPTQPVFVVLIVLYVLGIVAVLGVRETAALRPGAVASLRPRLAVPAGARRWFVALAPLVAAGWMFSGLFLGLAPSFDRAVFGITGGAANGVIVALQPTAAAVFSLLFARSRAVRSARLGAALALIGAGLAVTGIATAWLPLVVVGALAGGAGQGAGFGAALRVLAPQADNSDRGGLVSAVYVLAYTAYGAPVLLAGLASNLVPLLPVVLVYGVVVALLGALALVGIRRADRA